MTDMTDTVIIENPTSFTPELSEAIQRLVQVVGDHAKPLSDDDIQLIIESPSNHIFIARVQDTQRIVGMASLIIYRIPYARKAWIEDVAVEEDYRSHGIGRKLLTALIEFARQKKVHYIQLTSRPQREVANNFYIRMGFEKKDTNVYRMELQ